MAFEELGHFMHFHIEIVWEIFKGHVCFYNVINYGEYFYNDYTADLGEINAIIFVKAVIEAPWKVTEPGKFMHQTPWLPKFLLPLQVELIDNTPSMTSW